ncbi:MAG: haloacid dehalogenase-like hydrolase [Nakamurella sp.]
MRFTVGFDLDMTLIDPRPGMVALFDVLKAETGYPLDGAAFATRLGPPLTDEFAHYGIVGAEADALVERYRAHYAEIVIPLTVALPGAHAALAAVAAHGGDCVVVSGKHTLSVERHLEALGMNVSAAVGGLWSTAKASALREYSAEMFVGDHVGDIAGARAADALAIGVATGPMTEADLTIAGADVVLVDLTGFAAWLDSYLAATVH